MTMGHEILPSRSVLRSAAFVAVVFLVACAAPQTPVADSEVSRLLATADAAQGKRQFLQCRACHTLVKGGINTVGPNLYGLFGSNAGNAGASIVCW